MRFETAFRSGVMALAIAGGGAAFLVMGVAAVSWRSQCEANPSAGVCFLSAPTPATTTAVVAKRAEPAVPQPAAPELAVEAEPALAAASTTPDPVLPADPPPQQAMVAAAEMMSSTFDVLSDLKAEINGSDPAPDPLQTAVVASAEQTADPAALPTPTPLNPAAPTKRTVKLIPISPTGTPVTSAASDAIDAAEDQAPRAVALQQVVAADSDPALKPMAFADPATSVPAGTPARVLEVTENLANVRSGPSTDSEKLFVLEDGDEVKALAVAGDWVHIEIDNGKSGWMLGEFLSDADLDGLPEESVDVAAAPAVAEEPAAEAVATDVAEVSPSGGDVRRVLGSGVNVRASASSKAEKIFVLAPGEQVTVTDNNRGWLKITDDQGRVGWLYEDFVTGG